MPANWFQLLQSFGIIASFLLAAYGAYSQGRARRVSNYIELVKNHRELWKLQWSDPDLQSIMVRDVSATKRKITDKESRFLSFLFLHITCTFELNKTSNVIKVDEFKKDLEDLLSYPLIRKFWEENSRFYNVGFVSFVSQAVRLNSSIANNVPQKNQ